MKVVMDKEEYETYRQTFMELCFIVGLSGKDKDKWCDKNNCKCDCKTCVRDYYLNKNAKEVKKFSWKGQILNENNRCKN